MNKKVIFYFWGGIGNQLFIYFTMKTISIKYGHRIEKDTSYYSTDPFLRNFELDDLGIKIQETNFINKFNYFGGYLLKKVSYRLGFNILKPNTSICLEDKFTDRFKIKKKRNYLFHGYWQDYSFFDKYKLKICNDLNFASVVNNKLTKDKLKSIETVDVEKRVFLGLRLFQEVSNSDSPNKESINFYKRGIAFFKKTINEPVFFCFSNSKNAKLHLDSLNIDYVLLEPDLNNLSTISDLYLGTQFQNYILTNSTYYWWMQYLSKDVKYVYASIKWQNKKTIMPNWILDL